MNGLRFIIVLIAAIAFATLFHHEPTAFNGFSLLVALLGVALLASMVFKRSK